ncbi:unnamed protein product [Orchesella dallaii]|uniref:Uncharacterized protein n=1 Tax=Orchesella dallaii TaxID=48710 RepID=A0ABP1R7S8_9HEXA
MACSTAKVVAEVVHDNKKTVLEVPEDICIMVLVARKSRGLFKKNYCAICILRVILQSQSMDQQTKLVTASPGYIYRTNDSFEAMSRKSCVVDRSRYTTEEFYKDTVTEYEKTLWKNWQRAIADKRSSSAGKSETAVHNEDTFMCLRCEV